MPWDPASGQTFGEYVRAKNLQARPTGWSHATRDQVREYVGRDGHRVKDTRDQLGNRVVQHGTDSQSVIARPQTIRAHIPTPSNTGSPDVER